MFQPDYDDAAVVAMIDALKLFGIGASWGGYESLALPSTGTITRSAGTGAFGGEMVRFQVGLENLDELKADLEQGLAVLRAHRGAAGSGAPEGDDQTPGENE